MKRLVLSVFVFFAFFSVRAQQTVSIGTTQTNPKAVLWLKSEGQNQGLIIPIVTSLTAITTSEADRGMIVYNLTDNKIHYFNGGAWQEIGAGGTGGGGQTISISGND